MCLRRAIPLPYQLPGRSIRGEGARSCSFGGVSLSGSCQGHRIGVEGARLCALSRSHLSPAGAGAPNPCRGARLCDLGGVSLSSGCQGRLIPVQGAGSCALGGQYLFLIGCRGMQSASRVQDCVPSARVIPLQQLPREPNPCRGCRIVRLRRGIPRSAKGNVHLISAEGVGLCTLDGEYRGQRSEMTLMPASIARVHDTPTVFVVRGTRSPLAMGSVGLFMAKTLEFQS